MSDTVVRLASLTLQNIKNVKNGTISMPLANEKGTSYGGGEVLGIYGQNGSGKTAVVDTLFFLQQFMIGKEIDHRFVDYVDSDSDEAAITVEFKIYREKKIYEVGYHIELYRKDGGVAFKREYINCAINSNSERTNKNIFIDYNIAENDDVFRPQRRLEELTNKNKDILLDLIVAKRIAEKSNCSYIFGENSRDIFINNKNEAFENYSFVIGSLFEYALKDLFVIKTSHTGVISANILLPMVTGAKGDLAISLTEPVVVDLENKNLLCDVVEQINKVLYTIIPGMKIEVNDYGMQSLDSGEDGYKLELMSVRDGKKPIPIRMESEGIIKIISILNALIQAFGNPSICLVIDELDSGIFEYMLGELLNIFNESAKGQLIFTSHNLRALEMLDKNSVMFSTVNAQNRYIHFKNVKGSNNLRKLYIRSITLGGQDETIYEETDSLKIARAFRSAGRSLKHV